MNPLIGITTYYVNACEFEGTERLRGLPDQDMIMTTMDYCKAVKGVGAIPVLITSILDKSYIDKLTDKIDGFIFTGGSDINPLLYGKGIEEYCNNINPTRDNFELMLLKKVIEKDKPLLGICRGMQILNVFYGGTLCQDILTLYPQRLNHKVLNLPKWHFAHDVNIQKNTSLYELFGKENILVNSFHHQSIEKLGDGLTVTAIAKDSVIEGIEDLKKYLVMGVQWHPEMMVDKEPEQMRIFNYFIKKVSEKSS